MKIQAVSHSLPSWEVSNEEVIDLIKFHSKSTFSGNLDKTLRKINILLKKTGAETRYWIDKQINEKPIDHIIKVCEESLKKANLHKDDIDLLIYVGIGKGFLEPAQSYFVAKAMGMNNVRCFDITDACMSWMAAMQVADSFFKSNSYQRIMIVNGEFTVQGGALFNNYNLKSEEQLEYTFPTFTVGECSTCSILSPEDRDNFNFKFSSKTDLADICTIPILEYKLYCKDDDKLKNGEMNFTSFGADLHETAEIEAVELIKNFNTDDISTVFTHASSKNEWQKYADKAGLGDKIFHIYQLTGNLVSASVPTAISMSLNSKRLKRGDKMALWMGSAGMSFGVCIGNY